MPKRLPYDKTVVTQFRIELADLKSRSNKLNGSMATKILSDFDYHNGDKTVDLNGYEIGPVRAVLVLYSYEPFLISIQQTVAGVLQTVEQKCQGLFVFHGELERVMVKPVVESDTGLIRLKFLWA